MNFDLLIEMQVNLGCGLVCGLGVLLPFFAPILILDIAILCPSSLKVTASVCNLKSMLVSRSIQLNVECLVLLSVLNC